MSATVDDENNELPNGRETNAMLSFTEAAKIATDRASHVENSPIIAKQLKV